MRLTVAAALGLSVDCARAPAPPAPGPAAPSATVPRPAVGPTPGPCLFRPDAPLLPRELAPASAVEDPSRCARAPNPERGLFAFRDLLAPSDLASLRPAGVTLIYGRVLLDGYRDRPLDPPLFERLRAGFAAVRRAGLKVLPRFYYATDDQSADAAPGRALEHVAALAPLLRENADVIVALQAGFLGAWGEWHPEERASLEDRRALLGALLSALPPTRSVLVRRPFYKEALFGGPMSPERLGDAGPLGRIGHLNDCFLASADDRGTFRSPEEESYAAADSAFVPVGGETCAPNPPRTDCPSALAALARHHWSFLNRDYHPEVVAGWKRQGCLDEIACRLGYRFVLRSLAAPARARRGQPLELEVTIDNQGFARAANARPLELALAPLPPSAADPAATPPILLETGFDARLLAPGPGSATCLAARLPGMLPPGRYRVGLALPDPAPSLRDDPRQSARLFGDVEVDPGTGISWLPSAISVE